MNRCVIVGGADIGSYDFIKESLQEEDDVICCDSGLKHAAPLSLSPKLIVGDFDSYDQPDLPVETIVLPCEKDDTDTVYAVKEALNRGYEDFLLIGTAGGRLDHTLSNLSILLMLHHQKKHAIMLDDFSEISVAGKEKTFVDQRFSFFSLLCLTEPARGVTITNAKYPLKDAEISYLYPYAVSNEVLPGKTAEISVAEGQLLLVKTRR